MTEHRTESTGPARRSSARRKDGPSPGRVLAAAASVSAGIGLVGLIATGNAAGTTVTDAQPTQVVESPAGAASSNDGFDVVEGATPAPRPAPAPVPVTRSEGS